MKNDPILAPLGVLRAGGGLPGVSRFGKLGCDDFQSLEKCGAPASNDWN
jgi:hypothetical protein